jgi:segregation and condensation protein A
MSIATLELDLDLFSGPFDLLLTLILREEVDLLELQLADVVLAYLDHLEARGELDLETATEFIVLIAALLELKSRLMLVGEDDEELLDIEPAQAAEELLERMLEARRYRAAAGHLGELLKREEGVRFREAPLPASLRKTITQPADGSQSPEILGEALGRLLRMPPAISLRHIGTPRISTPARAAAARALQLRRGCAGRRPDDGRGHAVRAARAVQARRGRLGAAGELRRDRGPRARSIGAHPPAIRR